MDEEELPWGPTSYRSSSTEWKDSEMAQEKSFPKSRTFLPPPTLPLHWQDKPPPQSSLPVPPDEILFLLATAAWNFLHPDANGRDCSFVNPSSVGAGYQRVVAITSCCPFYLLPMIYTSSWCNHCYLVSSQFYNTADPHCLMWLSSISAADIPIFLHLFRPLSCISTAVFGYPTSLTYYHCTDTVIHPPLCYTLGNLPSNTTSAVINRFLLPDIYRNSFYKSGKCT